MFTFQTCFMTQPAGRAAYCQSKACYCLNIFRKISPFKPMGRGVPPEGIQNFIKNRSWVTSKLFEDQDRKIPLLQDSIGLAEMFSVESYPEPYCDIVDGMATACLEMSILELWANDGAFDQRTEQELEVVNEYLS